MHQSCEMVLLKGEEFYLFLVDLIVYGDVRHDILTMVDMNRIEINYKKNQVNEILSFFLALQHLA